MGRYVPTTPITHQPLLKILYFCLSLKIACNMKRTLIRNARLTLDEQARLHRIEITNGCISAVVTQEEVEETDGMGGDDDVVEMEEFEVVIDAKGATVFPGMHDSHIHVAMLGESLHYVNLIDCFSIEAMIDKIREKLQCEPTLPFVVGFNWDQTKLGRMPTRSDIDNISEKPIFLWRACWHIGVANSAALDITNIMHYKSTDDLIFDDSTRQWCFSFPGGAIDYDHDTLLPTGVLRERACEPVMASLSKFKSKEAYLRFIQEGLTVCLRKGITTVHTNDEHSLKLYQQLQVNNLLPIRVLLTPNQQELNAGTELMPIPLFHLLDNDSGFENNLPQDAGAMSSRLGMNRVKIFSDGSLGAETAAMKIFPNSESSQVSSSAFKGILMHTSEAMEEMVCQSTERGFRVEIHAIGDAAAEQVVSAIDRVNGKRRGKGLLSIERPLVTHCQVLGSDIIQRMHTNNIIANIQPSFVPTDMRWVMNRMTDSRQLQYSYAWHTLLHGKFPVHCAGGSDAPIEDASPWYGVFDAMFRSNLWRLPSDSEEAAVVFRMEERLSFSDALSLYTSGGAYAAGYEHFMGRVAVGQVADLVIMNASRYAKEELETPSEQYWTWLMTETPRLVLVGGQISHTRPGTDGSSEVEVVKEDSDFAGIREQYEAIWSQCSESKQQEKPLEGTAPFIPGKNGSFECRVEQKRNSRSDKIGRRGYCRCLLHMEYCT